MALLLVTLGTDGTKDWVQTPDGQRFALGSVSVLSFVSRLARGSKTAQKALDEFLKQGEALFPVDDERMWALLAPVRTRWGTGPFMTSVHGDLSPRNPTMAVHKRADQTTDKLNKLSIDAADNAEALWKSLNRLWREVRSVRDMKAYAGPQAVELDSLVQAAHDIMTTVGWGDMTYEPVAARMAAGGGDTSTIREDLSALRKVVGHLNALASQDRQDSRAVQQLLKFAKNIESAQTGADESYYLGESQGVETSSRSASTHDLVVDVYEQNLKLAQGILAKTEQTVEVIDRLASKGKRFNANRARADAALLATKVASICSQTELTESWVQSDLTKLAAQTNKLHGLFHSRAV